MKYECAEPEQKTCFTAANSSFVVYFARFVQCAYVNGDWQCLATEWEVNHSLKGDYVVRFAINLSSLTFT